MDLKVLTEDNRTIKPEAFLAAYPLHVECSERRYEGNRRLFRPETLALSTFLMEKEIQVKTSYIRCLRDEYLPISLQNSSAQELGAEVIYDVEADHNPQWSVPTEIAFILHEIGLEGGQ